MTLSSSKTLAFVSLPSFPINKFPRVVRANWPPSPPKVGGTRPSPAFPPPWAPPGQAVSTPPGLTRPGTEPVLRRRPHRLEPRLARLSKQGQRRAALPTPPAPGARPVPALRPRPRPPRPPRTAPLPRHNPRAERGTRGLRAARRAAPRLPQHSRLLLWLLPPLAHSLGRQGSGRRGMWAGKAAREELRPKRAPPSRPSTPSHPSAPPAAVGSAPRPSRQAPPLPADPAHSAGQRVKGGTQGRRKGCQGRCPCSPLYGRPAGMRFVVLTTIWRMRVSLSDLLLLLSLLLSSFSCFALL